MNLYLLTQTENTDYDAYSRCIVAARNAAKAKNVHPSSKEWGNDNIWEKVSWTWCSSPDKVEVEFIGLAAPDVRENTILCREL